MATTPAPSSSSNNNIRYERLLQVIQKALSESRKSFDTDQAIQDCYGEEGMMVFGSTTTTNNNKNQKQTLLHTVIDGMMEKIHDSVHADMLNVLKEKNVESKLQTLEDVVGVLRAAEQERAAREQHDKQSAQEALRDAKLPDDMTPDDVLRYRAHEILVAQKALLEKDLKQVLGETQELEKRLTTAQEQVKSNIGAMETAGTELERTADVCSMVS